MLLLRNRSWPFGFTLSAFDSEPTRL